MLFTRTLIPLFSTIRLYNTTSRVFLKDIQKTQPHLNFLDPAIVICNSLGMHNGMARKLYGEKTPFKKISLDNI